MSLVGNTASRLPYYAVPSAAQAVPQAATVEDLKKLSAGDQVTFVEANGTGSPPALLLPTADGTGESLASLAPSGAAVDVTAAPPDFLAFLARTPTGSAADTPSATAFAAWDGRLQTFYFDRKAAGSPLALFLPDGMGQALLTARDNGALRVAKAPDQFWADLYGTPYNGKQPQAPAARADFSGWDREVQTYYFAQKASGSPPALVLADGARQALALAGPSGDILVGTPSDQFWADLTGAPFGAASPQVAPTLADFVSGGPAAQAFFLARKGLGTPKTVLLSDGGAADSYRLASLGSDGTVSIADSTQVAGFSAELSDSSAGSKYDSATLEQFQGWPASYQAYYLEAKGGGTLVFASSATPTPDSVRQASLSASGIVFNKVQSVVDLVGTATSAPSAASILAQTGQLTSDAFSTWPLTSQTSYLQSNGTGAPPALLLPTASGGQALVSAAPGSNVVEITTAPDGFLDFLDAQPSATTLSPAQFSAMTSAQQAAYLASRTDAVTAAQFHTWSASNQAAYLATEADPATLVQFQSWPAAFQTYYLANKGAGSPPSLTFAGRDGSVIATLSSDGASVQLTATSTKLADDAAVIALTTPIYPHIFFDLTPEEQLQYANNRLAAKLNAYQTNNALTGGTLPPPTGVNDTNLLDLYGSASGYTTTTMSIAGQNFQVALPTLTPDALFSGADYSTFGTSSVTGATFATWPPQVRSAYVEQNASGPYPKTVVLGDGVTVAIVPSAGAPATGVADTSSATVGFSVAYSGTTPGPADFLQWPYACQLAWLRKQTASPATLGTNPNDIAIALNADGSGFQVAMATDLSLFLGLKDASQALTPAQRTQAVGALDFSLFSKVAPPLLQAQLLATLADPGSSPPIVTVAATSAQLFKAPAVVSAGTAATGQGFTIEPLPSNYSNAPGALTPAAFMAWSPAVRESYALAQKKAPLYIGSGADVLSVTFSPADGTLQVGLPRSLANIVFSGAGTASTTTALADTLLPYNYLPGSAVGTSSAVNDAVSAALFPILDGSGGAHNVVMSAQQQLDFAKGPTALAGSTFAGWPTALQLQYLRTYQAPGTPLTIGSGSDTLDALMQTTALAGAVPKVYIVQNLQKNDIGTMSYADQATLAKSKAFTALANGLGLIPDDGTVAALGGNDVPDPNAGLTTAVTPATLSAFGFVQTMFVRALNTIDNPTMVSPAPGLPDGNMPAADRKVFEDEVNLLRRQTFGSPLPTSQQNQAGGQAIFSPKDIQDKLTAIIQRFTRVNAFSSVANSKTANAGYFQITGFTGYDSSKPDEQQFIYNPNGAADYTVEQFLAYYCTPGGDYRDAQTDVNGFTQAVAQSFMNANLPSAGATGPVTLNNLSIPLKTLDHKDTDSAGNATAGDSAFVDGVTIAEVPSTAVGDLVKGSIFDQKPENTVDNTFTMNGKTYEILGITSTVVTHDGVPSAQYAHAYSRTDGIKYAVFTLSGFENFWQGPNGNSINDDGASILAALGDLSKYKDGAAHSIPVADLTYRNGDDTFTVNGATVRFVPAAASTDNNATIDSGYQTFMAQEKSVLDLANRADQLATSGKIGGTQQNLDVPNLVYLFMMYANLTGEAVLRADTEEVNQTNAVLNEYAIMQKIINQTVAAIKPGDDGKPGSGALRGSNPDGTFTAQDQAALAMFTRGNANIAGTGHVVAANPPLSPIELLQTAFARPYLTNGEGAYVSSSQWSSDGTSLSDAVTQLNQVSQLKMNDINSETKQKDREFDLANTALQKMSDIVNKIAAAV